MSKNERFKIITSGYLMLVRNGKILLSRRFNTGYEDGKYSLPAGHIEDGETLTGGTCREIREEIGVVLTPEDVLLVHVMHRKHMDIRMDFFFTTGRKNLSPVNCEPDRCDELRWVPVDKLPKNTIPYISAAIRNFRKKIFYSEFGWR